MAALKNDTIIGFVIALLTMLVTMEKRCSHLDLVRINSSGFQAGVESLNEQVVVIYNATPRTTKRDFAGKAKFVTTIHEIKKKVPALDDELPKSLSTRSETLLN